MPDYHGWLQCEHSDANTSLAQNAILLPLFLLPLFCVPAAVALLGAKSAAGIYMSNEQQRER